MEQRQLPRRDWLLLDRGRLLVFLFLSIILIVSVFLRFVVVETTEVDTPVRADAAQYLAYAYNLKFSSTYSRDAAGIGRPDSNLEPDAFRPPGYPLFLAAFLPSHVTFADLDRVLLAQAGLSSLSVLFAYLLFRSLLPVWAALLAASLVGVSPHLVVANLYLLTETLFCFLVLLWMLLLIRGLGSDRAALWLLGAGAVLGYSALVRPSAQYLLPLLAITVYLWLPPRRRVASVTGFVLGFVLVFGPWLGRNLVTLRTASDPGLMVGSIHHGMYPGLMYRDDPRSLGIPYRADPGMVEIGRDISSVLGEIRRRFSEEPGRHLRWYLFGKPTMLWQWDIVAGMGDVWIYPVVRSPYFENRGLFHNTHRFMRGLHEFLVLCALLGMVASWLPGKLIEVDESTRKYARLISLVLVYFTLLHMVAAPYPRYSVPLRPLLYGMAMYGIWWSWRAFRGVAAFRHE